MNKKRTSFVQSLVEIAITGQIMCGVLSAVECGQIDKPEELVITITRGSFLP